MAGWRQKRQHMRHYNHTARLYNIRYTEEQNLKIKTAVENLELRRESSILDLGCGTGLLFPKIQKLAKNIVGLDISKGMLKEAEHFIKLSRNVHLILADADHTPLRNDYFDLVFVVTLLQNMPNPYNTLREIKRIAKPGASIIVTGLKKNFTENSFVELLRSAKLEAKLLKTDASLKCYIAMCRKCN